MDEIIANLGSIDLNPGDINLNLENVDQLRNQILDYIRGLHEQHQNTADVIYIY